MAKLINKLLLIVLTLFSASCTIAEPKENISSIKINSVLKQCVSFDNQRLTKHLNTTLLNIDYTHQQSIGYCGCKSSLAKYQVLSQSQSISSGLLTFPKKETQLNITLSNSPKLLQRKPITVEFTCAQPQ